MTINAVLWRTVLGRKPIRPWLLWRWAAAEMVRLLMLLLRMRRSMAAIGIGCCSIQTLILRWRMTRDRHIHRNRRRYTVLLNRHIVPIVHIQQIIFPFVFNFPRPRLRCAVSGSVGTTYRDATITTALRTIIPNWILWWWSGCSRGIKGNRKYKKNKRHHSNT